MKRDKLISAIFTRRTMRFDDVVTLLKGLDCTYVRDDAGSRVHFTSAGGVRLNLHAPHPGNELNKYQMKDVRDFLKELGHAP